MDISKCYVCGELSTQIVDARRHFGLEESGFQNTVLHCPKDQCTNFAKEAMINNFAQADKYLYDKDNKILKRRIFIETEKNKCDGSVICYDNKTKSVIVLNKSEAKGPLADICITLPLTKICGTSNFSGPNGNWRTLMDFTYIDMMPLLPKIITKEKRDEIITNIKNGVSSVKIHDSSSVVKMNVTTEESNDWKVIQYLKRRWLYSSQYNHPCIICQKNDHTKIKIRKMRLHLFIELNPDIKATDFKSKDDETIGDGYSYDDFEYEFNYGQKFNNDNYLAQKKKREEEKRHTSMTRTRSEPCCVM